MAKDNIKNKKGKKVEKDEDEEEHNHEAKQIKEKEPEEKKKLQKTEKLDNKEEDDETEKNKTDMDKEESRKNSDNARGKHDTDETRERENRDAEVLEKEKTKGKEVKGKTFKGDKDLVLDDEKDDERGQGNYKTIVDQIIENLRIVVSGSKQVNLSDIKELVNIEKATCEMPRQITDALPTELEFATVPRGEWCIMKGRIRGGEKDWTNYEEFIKEYRHIVEKGVKELYRYFSLQDVDYSMQLRVIPSNLIGFGEKLENNLCERVRSLWIDNAQAFQILPDGGYRDTIPIVVNPVLSDIVQETERFIFDERNLGVALHEWVKSFVSRKDENWSNDIRMIFGTNDSYWMRVPHPRLVGQWLNIIPNANLISIPYSLKFIGPQVATRAVNVTTSLSSLKASSNQMSSLPTLVTSPVTETNKLDFESILKAQLLPGQIWIRIIYDSSDAIELNAMGALAAKLLLCSSPTSRNVEPESCDTSDRVLAAWLLINNYSPSGNEQAPLEVRRKNRTPSQFAALGTELGSGRGWCNARCPDYVPARQPALYVGVDRVPHIGNAPPQRREVNYQHMGATYSSPLMIDVENALSELSSDNSRNGEPIFRWMRQILPYYQQYIGDFNRHSLMYGETGFRLSDRRVDEMQRLANGVGELNASLKDL